MNKAKQKRQHTVPRCYLQNFADKDGFVWVLDTKDKIFKIKPENILVESHFYTVTLKNGQKSLVVEDTLANIEGAYSNIFERKISKNLFLTAEERAQVSVFIAALMLRTEPHRASMHRMVLSLKKSMEEWQKEYEDNPEARRIASAVPSSGRTIKMDDIEEYLKNYKEEHAKSIIKQLPHVAQLIFDMKWSIWEAPKGGYVTSDDPLVLMRPAAIKKYGPNAFGSLPGLAYKDVDVTLPLSSTRLLLAGWILEQDSYIQVSDEMVERMNYRTITRSSQRVITSSKAQAEGVRMKYNRTKHKQ